MGPEQFGRLNMWAMLKAMLNENVAIFVNGGAPSNGTSGTFANFAGKGSIVVDFTNGNLYVNTGTKSSPTWSALSVAVQAGTSVAKFTAALSPASVGANTSAEETFTVIGVVVGDVIFVNKPTAQAGLGIVGVRVSDTDEVGITFGNFTAAPIVPTAAETYEFGVIR